MDIERLVLSGGLFSTSRPTSPVRSSSPSRSPSPDPLFPSNDDPTDSDFSYSPQGSMSNLPTETPTQSSGTGVKSVIRDRNAAVSMEMAKRAQDIKETNRRMEKMALTARTYAEDEQERLHQKAREEGWDQPAQRMFQRTGRFGHLREVGEEGFVDAIDGEASGTWVVLHIYDPTLARCHDVDAVLARLARQFPETKFLRARAAAIGFASSSSSAVSRSALTPISENLAYSDDDDDLYDSEHEEDVPQDSTDADMLPTLLVYRSGQMIYNWVRVDWEAEAWSKRSGKGPGADGIGIEGLLRGKNILQQASNGNCGFSSDDDDLALEFSSGDRDAGEDDDDIFDL